MKKIIYIFAACIFSLTSSAQLSIQSGATIYLGGNAQIVLQDVNLVNDGTITVAAIGRFSFTGSANSQVSGSQQPAFNELEIAKTGTNKLILQRAINVNGKIVFTSGLIDLNNNNINLGNTAFLETENENSRVIGVNGGQLVFSTTLNAPSSANPGNFGAAAIRDLKNDGLNPAHYDLRFAKPLDEVLLHEVFRKFDKVITVEDGTVKGGIGSAVLEFMNEHHYK